VDDVELGAGLGRFLRELRTVPAVGGPLAGQHSYGRGLHPRGYADEMRDALRRLGGTVDQGRCAAIWRDAGASDWAGAPVWFHGDLAPGNVLVTGGRLSAVIDFGTCGVGDPACDLVIAWTWLGTAGRAAFRDAVDLDDGTWARARGWALWKALITDSGSPLHGEQQRALRQLLVDA
jgi:aminoglycoside phosphotransferase (APT) family kinase protein